MKTLAEHVGPCSTIRRQAPSLHFQVRVFDVFRLPFFSQCFVFAAHGSIKGFLRFCGRLKHLWFHLYHGHAGPSWWWECTCGWYHWTPSPRRSQKTSMAFSSFLTFWLAKEVCGLIWRVCFMGWVFVCMWFFWMWVKGLGAKPKELEGLTGMSLMLHASQGNSLATFLLLWLKWFLGIVWSIIFTGLHLFTCFSFSLELFCHEPQKCSCYKCMFLRKVD